MTRQRKSPETMNAWTVDELGRLWKYAMLKDRARAIKRELLKRHTDRSFRAKLWERRRLAEGMLIERNRK